MEESYRKELSVVFSEYISVGGDTFDVSNVFSYCANAGKYEENRIFVFPSRIIFLLRLIDNHIGLTFT